MKKLAALTAPIALGVFLSVSPAFAATAQNVSVPAGFTTKTFATGTANQSNPDDITSLNGNMYVAYQNGVSPKGGPAKNGAKQSSIVEYDKTGKTIQSWNITGKCDGLTADPANNRILATVNEDGNSSMDIIKPKVAEPQHLSFKPDPSSAAATGDLATGGGTALSVINGNYYLTASAPTADSKGKYSKAALFQANIDTAKGIVTLTSVLKDNAMAKDAMTGGKVTLNLSDPDSNGLVPQNSTKYAGDFMLDSQGDKELIFIHNLGSSNQTQTRLQISAQADDVIWATSGSGTLYVSDTGTNKVYAVKGTFKPGTVFVSVGTNVGTLDLNTGKITPFVTGLSDSHGMTFIPGNTPKTGGSTASNHSTVKGATSPETGFPMNTLLVEGLGLLILGGGTAVAFRRKKN